MRAAVLLVLVGCGFDVSATGRDAAIDTPDAPAQVTWDVDATSKKGVPTSPGQWRDVIAANAAIALDPPPHIWMMQETAGLLADTGTAANAPLAPLNGPGYHIAVPGWSRFGASTDDTLINQGFYSNATGDLDGESYLVLAYVAVGTPSDTRSLVGIGENADHRFASLSRTPRFGVQTLSGAPVLGAQAPGTTVHPLVLAIDGPSQTLTVYTDQEKLAAPAAMTSGRGGLIVFGNAVSVGSAPARYVYGVMFTGAHANATAASVKALLQTLGWTVTGY